MPGLAELKHAHALWRASLSAIGNAPSLLAYLAAIVEGVWCIVVNGQVQKKHVQVVVFFLRGGQALQGDRRTSPALGYYFGSREKKKRRKRRSLD